MRGARMLLHVSVVEVQGIDKRSIALDIFLTPENIFQLLEDSKVVPWRYNEEAILSKLWIELCERQLGIDIVPVGLVTS